MIVYVDSSALLKRVVLETESAALVTWLQRRDQAGDLLVGSTLCWIETWRALRRAVTPRRVSQLGDLALSGIAEHPVSDAVLVRARTIGPSSLRTLDAVHLASAVEVGATDIATYDDRLAAAAELLGLVVNAPQPDTAR